MLKKAGIIVAASVAGLVALSPLAFAADKPDNDQNDRGYSGDCNQEGTAMGYGGGLVSLIPLGLAANVAALNCNEINVLSHG